jgi:hypothetical protein
MICSKCKKKVYRAFSYTDSDGKWHSGECESCYPLGKVNSWSPLEKLKSRTLMPDGSVATGREGIRVRDMRRKMQSA